MQCPYVGLSNQGATCYMNSYLQHLYMNQNFRAILFSLQLKPNIQKNEADCIPYQLQKLFCKLNLKINKMISTKDLTKSFQWTTEQTFQEHDINEFGKILYDAISQSLSNSSIQNQQNFQIFQNFLKRYKGIGVNYLKCLNCQNQKVSEESFSEINLVIHNEFEKLRFKNLEMSLLNNIKPIILDGDNKVSCEKCGDKHDHEKGYQYQQFPDFLVFNLNRFVYDLYTYDRKKLDDYFKFPLILDLNNYLGNYDSVSQQTGINMQDAESLEFSNQQNDSTQKPFSMNNIIKTKKGKKFKNIKTSKKTTEFLKQMRKQKKQKKDNAFVILAPDNNTEQETLEKQSETKKDSDEGDSQIVQHSENLEEDLDIKLSADVLQLKKTKSKAERPKKEYKKQESNSIVNDINQNLEDITIQTKSEINQNEKSKQEFKENQYALHSVFIHKGSAYSGHYYVYIKSFENQKWYLFDDYQVKEVHIADVLKDAFGGPQSSATAYNLFYQKIEQKVNQDSNRQIVNKEEPRRLRKKSFSEKKFINEKNQQEEENKHEIKSQYFQIQDIIHNTKCPEYMKHIIEQEMKEEEKKANVNKIKRKKKVVRHRLYYKLKVQLIEISIKKKFIDFEKLCQEKLQIEESESNWRLRLYNRFRDEMLQTFDDKKDKTLEQLKLIAQKNFIVELKEDDQQFQSFDVNSLELQIVFWDPKCYHLDWKPNILKIKISKQKNISELIDSIKEKYQDQLKNIKEDYQQEDQLNLLLKKTFKNGLLKGEFVSNQSQKQIQDTQLSNQTLLYVDVGQHSLWEQFFESENNKIIIQFNYPAPEDFQSETKVEYGFKLKIDLNEKLKDFKNKVKKMFNLGELQDFIIKKGGISGIELRDYSKQIRTLGIINNSFLYLQFGKAITLDEIKVNFFVCLGELSQNYFSLERDIVFLKEIAINPNQRPQKVLEEIQSQLPPIYPFLIKSSALKNSQINFENQQQGDEEQLEKDKFNQIYTKNQKELDLQNQRYRLYQKLNKNTKNNKLLLNHKNTRIREKNGLILTKTYKDVSMKHQGCVERKKLVLELFQSPLQNSEALIYWTFLDVQKFQFEPVKEIKIFKRATLRDLAEVILQQKTNISLDQLEATKIRDVREFMIDDILGHRFYDMNSTNILSTQPFYLESDGCLFIFKNKDENLTGKQKSFKKNPNMKFFSQQNENQLKIFVKEFDDQNFSQKNVLPEELLFSRIFERSKLDNGIDITTLKSQSDKAVLSVFVKCGSVHEKNANSGSAHFLEHMMFKGTKKRTREQLEVEIEDKGGFFNAFTTREYTSYILEMPKEQLKWGVELLSDLLIDSLFLDSSIQSEKDTINTELLECLRDPCPSLLEFSHENSYRNDAIGKPILGRRNNINSVTRDMVVDFHQNNYVGQNFMFVNAGNIEHKQLEDLINQNFSKLPKNREIRDKELLQNINKIPQFTPTTMFIESPPSNIKFGLYWEACNWYHEDYLPFMLFQRVLGDYEKQFLFESEGEQLHGLQDQLRKHLYIEKVDTAFLPYLKTGIFGCYIETQPENAVRGYDFFVNFIQNYIDKISERELQTAKYQIIPELLKIENGVDFTQDIGQNLLHLDRIVTKSEFIQRVQDLDIQDLKNVMNNWIINKPFSLTVWGPGDSAQKLIKHHGVTDDIIIDKTD